MLAQWMLICLGLAVTAEWSVDFTDRQASLERFNEDDIDLHTSGCRACAEPSHVHYNQQLFTCQDGKRQPSGHKGLQLVMDYNVSCGVEDVKLATGHLSGKEAFMYGTFSFIMRSHHLQDSCKLPATYAGFSCISLYNSKPVWNEVAICFTKWAPMQEVHLSVYAGELQNETEVKVPVFGAYVTLDEPANAAFHNYSLQRLPSGLTFWVDGKKKMEIDKSQCSQLPTEPMFMKVILRPHSDTIEGNSTVLSIQSMSADPFDDARAHALAARSDKNRANLDTITKKYMLIENIGGSFSDWEEVLKPYVFEALELKYPGVGLRDKYPIKLARILPHEKIAVLKFGNKEQAAKVVALVNERRGFTKKRKILHAKTFPKPWQARLATEAEYHYFGEVKQHGPKQKMRSKQHSHQQKMQSILLARRLDVSTFSFTVAVCLMALLVLLYLILSGGTAMAVAALKHRKLLSKHVPASLDPETLKQV
mmetsp:Transcript_42443/g.79689  ORF Transcript_42443/g.79689 Transcript_42443/m.79689 type:complete len:479 (+) Transcript_42443:64-1500(+)